MWKNTFQALIFTIKHMVIGKLLRPVWNVIPGSCWFWTGLAVTWFAWLHMLMTYF